MLPALLVTLSVGSPSSRRAWIEIRYKSGYNCIHGSPSSRRAWIEITTVTTGTSDTETSPSSRRAWIEIRRQ